MYEGFDGLFAAGREQQTQHVVVGRARRIVDEDLFDEAREAMLDLVDETQLVGVDILIAARTVEVARLERELIHETREEAGLVDRRQLHEMADLRIDIHDGPPCAT